MRRSVIACAIIVAGLLAACTAPSGGGAASQGAPAPAASVPAPSAVAPPAY